MASQQPPTPSGAPPAPPEVQPTPAGPSVTVPGGGRPAPPGTGKVPKKASKLILPHFTPPDATIAAVLTVSPLGHVSWSVRGVQNILLAWTNTATVFETRLLPRSGEMDIPNLIPGFPYTFQLFDYSGGQLGPLLTTYQVTVLTLVAGLYFPAPAHAQPGGSLTPWANGIQWAAWAVPDAVLFFSNLRDGLVAVARGGGGNIQLLQRWTDADLRLHEQLVGAEQVWDPETGRDGVPQAPAPGFAVDVSTLPAVVARVVVPRGPIIYGVLLYSVEGARTVHYLAGTQVRASVAV